MRKEKGFSQEGFAQRAQLDRSFYGRIERGTQNIALTTLCLVADGLGVKPGELLDDIMPTDRRDLSGARRASINPVD